jgi:ribosomal protein L16/L10AE
MNELKLIKFKKRFLIKLKTIHSRSLIQHNVALSTGFGFFCFKLNIPKIIISRYTDIIRKTLIRLSRRKIHFWYYHILTQIVTKKPKEIRMGKGKGSFSHWVEKINLNRFLFFMAFFHKYYVHQIINIFRRITYKTGHSANYQFKYFFLKKLSKSYRTLNYLFGNVI